MFEAGEGEGSNVYNDFNVKLRCEIYEHYYKPFL